MKKILLMIAICMVSVLDVSAQMSDAEVMQFVAREYKNGTSQSQIVTRLMSRGVKIEQIRKIRNQYDSQIKSRGLTGAADGAVSMAAARMEGNSDGTVGQETVTAKRGTSSQVYADAASEHETAERDVEATAGTAPEVSGKKVFGRDIFRTHRLSFEPNMNVPTPTDYVLGPGDQLVIDIYGASQKTLVHTISAEGTITVGGVGPVYVSGLSVAAAKSKIAQKVGKHYSGSDLRVTLGQMRTILVNIMGEVRTPGTYHLSAFSNVFHALYMAGGISSLGTLRNIKVYRNGRLVTVVDMYEFILNGRLAGNINLKDNDVIKVDPYESLVGITGNVKRPMFYEMRKDESVGTVIKYAGGFLGDAYKKSVRLVRQAGERFTVHNVEEFDLNTFKVLDGDAISVDGMLNRYDNMVEIKGAVFRPGQFNLNEGTNTVRSLIEAAAGLTEDAFTTHAIIHRLKPDRSLQIIPVDVEGIMNGTTADVVLQNEDVVFIPTQEELRKERSFTITGEVMSPGSYQYADNTTIEDLIVQAGGLRDGANLARIDVSRRINDPHATKKTRDIAQTFTFDIKDGLVITGDKGFVLEPYDIVHVRRSPGYVMPRNISVTGEVNYEGTFTLEKKNLRLTDAIKMAGGLTEDAYIKGARLIRHMSDEERQRQTAVLEAISNNLGRKDSVAWNKLDLEATYTIGIELDKALENPGSDLDIVLREGDRIDVPEYNGTVKIAGDVQFPNTVTYTKGKNYRWYIKNAGGFSETAKKRKTFIIYPNGMMAEAKPGVKIEPGSEIVVPSRKPKHYWNATQWIGALGSLTSLASMVTAIAYLTK